MKPGLIPYLLLFITPAFASALQFTNENKPPMHAVRLNEPIHLDGVLDEPVWENEFGYSYFSQLNPLEGKETTEKTVVRIAYNDEALYVGARMYDSAPDSIIARLARRDLDTDADAVYIALDPYYDRRSGFYFGLNAAGTLYDGTISNDEWTDDSWDGVWEGKVQIDDLGWTCEMRIPFSQLRFKDKDEYLWAVNFLREIERKKEEDYIVYTPKNGSGFVSRFVDLIGIKNIHSSRNLELLPYTRGKAAFTHPEAANPYDDGSQYTPGAGLDVKYGIGSNLTLDMTLNPDFGQVEVDPAVVNLTDYETFYQEKRPFFIEGASIFNFGQGGSRSNWSFNWGSPNFFYSRRIGRPPQGELPDNDYADVPESANIIGAAKITGKVGNNWNIGVVNAVTSREHAEYSLDGRNYKTEVEPASYYSVLRAQKEIKDGRYGIGFLSTLTNHFFQRNDLQDELNKNAYGFGIDGWIFPESSKTWVISSWIGGTHLRANREQMLNVQQSSRHYFQRPDAKHVHLDSSATGMTGAAGRILINKQKGNVIFNSAVGFISPGFDVSDMGYMWNTDVVNVHIGGGYKWTEPGKIIRNADLLAAVFQNMDFDQNIIWKGVWHRGDFQFVNYTSFNYALAYIPETVSNRQTRGGPLMLNPPGWEADFSIGSDNRKPFTIELDVNSYNQLKNDRFFSIGVEMEWKVKPNLTISFEPDMDWDEEYSQWVDFFDDPTAINTYAKRYVFATLKQNELSAGIRINWTFTPKLSFQLYAQPLISTGDYSEYKELAKPKTFDFNIYDSQNIIENIDELQVDPDGSGPAESFTFDNPDFDFKSLRGNAVLRWEYSPGSTLYFVWTQHRSDSEYQGDFRFNRSLKKLWTTESDNIFMIKMTYWWNM
ncbi:carbohydrate binding family 9 domain-containing protein [candidate division KSB1 bacterium]|nr:carbohydrate binding family 9 domain-containing protein [candidate division KSB1 bacterium]